MNIEKEMNGKTVLEIVAQKIEKVSNIGFGEIRIVIRNGAVYRILSTEDELLEKNK